MEPAIDFLSVILLAGAAQGLFLALGLLRVRKENRLANRYFALFLVIFSLTLVDEFLHQSRYYTALPHLLGTFWPLTMLFGPLLYFYVKSHTARQAYTIGARQLLHFIPFVFSLFYHLPLYFWSAAEKIGLFMQRFAAHGPSNVYTSPDLIAYLEIIQFLAYLFICTRLLYQHRRAVKNDFSYLEKVDLAWLRILVVATLCVWAIYAYTRLLSPYLGLFDIALSLVHLSIVVLVYGMGYLALGQPSIFTRFELKKPDMEPSTPATMDPDTKPVIQELAQKPATSRRKYERSSLTPEQADQLLVNLRRLMARDKPHLENELTLPALASQLGCSSNHLSQVINEKLNENFFDFVNRYRIEEAKRLLIQQGRPQKILAIALDAGFNSKSAFYNAFKKQVHMTPAQYRSQSAEAA